MNIFTEEEKWEIRNKFDNWPARDAFLEKLIDNQNELIEKVEALENKINFHFPEEE